MSISDQINEINEICTGQKSTDRLLLRATEALRRSDISEASLLLALAEASLLCQETPAKDTLQDLATARIKVSALETDIKG